ncbi:MAG: hypothetical protein GY772_21610 [bacterium]|nr:hypothetical protein [bacterium]
MAVLELCGGTGAGFLALELLLGHGVATSAGHWDTDVSCGAVARHVHADPHKLHLGHCGNVITTALREFPSATVVVAGPPCPPLEQHGAAARIQ